MPDSSGIFCFNYSASIPSNSAIILTASSREWPHMSGSGWKTPQMRGRSGWPKILQRKSSSRLTHLTPAGLPFGIPGMGELIEITVQQAAQLGRQSMTLGFSNYFNIFFNDVFIVTLLRGSRCKSPFGLNFPLLVKNVMANKSDI